MVLKKSILQFKQFQISKLIVVKIVFVIDDSMHEFINLLIKQSLFVLVRQMRLFQSHIFTQYFILQQNISSTTSLPQASPKEKKDITSAILSKSNMARSVLFLFKIQYRYFHSAIYQYLSYYVPTQALHKQSMIINGAIINIV